MLLNTLNNKLLKSAAALGCLIAFTGCSLINDELPECNTMLRVRFTYDYNLKNADAFAQEVESVNVWAFDSSGAFVWSASASGDALKSDGFAIDTPLTAGTYDFVSWCGLKENDDFNLATYTPATKEELEVKLRTVATDSAHVSWSHFSGLYHGMLSELTYNVEPNNNTVTTVEVPLMKDTNDIRVLLQRYNGEELSADDFEVKITIPDAWLAWDNAVIPTGPMVTYLPWEIKQGSAAMPDEKQRTVTSLSALLYDFSSSRLMVGADATLTVVRTSDNTDIIRIPIIDYFLMVKGHYTNPDGSPLTDQQYLDRQDDYSILFFIDENNGWYVGYGIYINAWAVVPPQEQPV